MLFALTISICCTGCIVCIIKCVTIIVQFTCPVPQITPLEDDEENPNVPIVELQEKSDIPIADATYTQSTVVIANMV